MDATIQVQDMKCRPFEYHYNQVLAIFQKSSWHLFLEGDTCICGMSQW